MKNLLIIFFAVAAAAVVYVFQLREAWLTRDLTYERAREGYVTHDEVLPAVFVRSETVVYAPGAGALSFTVPDGQRARKGETVARVDGRDIIAPGAGLFCARVDGLEEILTPAALLEGDLEELFAECGGAEEAAFKGILPAGAGETATENEPASLSAAGDETGAAAGRNYAPAGGAAGKIINNLRPAWAYIAAANTQGVLKGDSISVNVDGALRSCTVERVAVREGGLVVSFPQYINTVTETRVKEVGWQKQAPTRGVVVSTAALFALGEEVGIYAVESGVINFRRVKVLDRNDAWASVDNLRPGYIVVTNPRDGLQGMAVSATVNAVK
ncbi:MAG: hypothetical protein LBH21_02635 [Gracilibacteraceae bacterium]|jgi:hypothetical protein|nr:hypothetical protein [Gracilibacteraceae bacterium]